MLEGKHGEFWLEFSSGSLFCVTRYEGFDDKHYICLHSSSLSLYHKGGGRCPCACARFRSGVFKSCSVNPVESGTRTPAVFFCGVF